MVNHRIDPGEWLSDHLNQQGSSGKHARELRRIEWRRMFPLHCIAPFTDLVAFTHVADPSSGVGRLPRRVNSDVEIFHQVLAHGVGARAERTNYDDVSDVGKVGKAIDATTPHQRDNGRLKTKGCDIKCDRGVVSIVDNHICGGQAQLDIGFFLNLCRFLELTRSLTVRRPR